LLPQVLPHTGDSSEEQVKQKGIVQSSGGSYFLKAGLFKNRPAFFPLFPTSKETSINLLMAIASEKEV